MTEESSSRLPFSLLELPEPPYLRRILRQLEGLVVEEPEEEEETLVALSVNGVTLWLTPHAQARCQQRGISGEMILTTLSLGKRYFSYGDVVYTLTERKLRRSIYRRLADRLRGLTVVRRPDGVIRTVKWDFDLRKPGPLRRSNWKRWLGEQF